MRTARLGIRKVYIEVTNYCNFSCDFCPLGLSGRPRRHLDFSLYTQAIDEIANHQIADSVAFHVLGEPLMYPHIFEAVQYASRKGLRTSITTNGSLLTEGRARRLTAAGLNRLTLSLQRFGPEAHEARRAPISFDKYYQRLLNGVRYVNQNGDQTHVLVLLMNVTTKRLFDTDRLVNLSWDHREYENSLATVIRDFYAVLDEPGASEDAIKRAVRSLGALDSVEFRLNDRTYVTVRPFFDWGNAFNGRHLHPSGFGYCGLAFKSLGILSDGRVVLCCGDHDGGTALGNLVDRPLSAILLSDRARSIARAMNHYRLVEPKCQACFASTHRLKTAAKVLLFSAMFKIVQPGPGKQVKQIDPLAL